MDDVGVDSTKGLRCRPAVPTSQSAALRRKSGWRTSASRPGTPGATYPACDAARGPAPTMGYWAPVSLVVTWAGYREDVLEADVIGDEEECMLRDHLLAVHPNTIQPETRSVLLKHFVVTEEPPAA